VAAESGAEDLLLRPLCAKNLQPTKPEREGWVDRNKLYDFHGRNRKPQIALAKQFGFDDFATPAGGCCFLTDESYSSKLVDLWTARNSREYELDDIMLLKVGRHIRPKADFKMIIARDAGESKFLEGYRKQFTSLYSTSHNGPMAIIDGDIEQQDFPLAASIVARFGQGRHADEVAVEITVPDNPPRHIQACPMKVEQVPQEWYV
jgi:tRNA U34 2-thiouridine synthase MnmA/TrmU